MLERKCYSRMALDEVRRQRGVTTKIAYDNKIRQYYSKKAGLE